MIDIWKGGIWYKQSYQKFIGDDNPQMSSVYVSDCCWFHNSHPLLFCRHVYWTDLHPDYLFLMSFVRCQLTVTITLLLVFGPKASEVQRSDVIASSKIVEELLTANWTKYAFYWDQWTGEALVDCVSIFRLLFHAPSLLLSRRMYFHFVHDLSWCVQYS